jgi:hypothetical protein
VILIAGQVYRLAIHGPSGGGIDELLDPVLAGALQDVEGTHDVHIRIKERIHHGAAYIYLGRMVIDHFGSLLGEDLVQIRATDIHVVEASLGVDVLPLAG